MDLVACGAAMHEDPLPVASDRDRDRLHAGTTVRVAVTRHVVVQVKAPEAGWTVVAVSGARCVERYIEAATSTAEGA
jgi:hypothetical protein